MLWGSKSTALCYSRKPSSSSRERFNPRLAPQVGTSSAEAAPKGTFGALGALGAMGLQVTLGIALRFDEVDCFLIVLISVEALNALVPACTMLGSLF